MREQSLFIDGKWTAGEGSQPVHSPWDGRTVGSFALARPEQVSAAVASAAQALAAGLETYRRADILAAASRRVAERSDEFAELIRDEAGKPIAAARAEVGRAVDTLRISGEEARRLEGEQVPMDGYASGSGMLAFTLPGPRGVVAAITPFNFPLNLVAHKVGPALAAGCPVVLKPSERTPLTAGFLVEVFEEVGLPAGWLNLVTGDPAAVVSVLQTDERVAVISFTGSAEVGWAIKAGSPAKHHLLELGSNTGMIVEPDADLDAAVAAAVASGFSYSGQTCVSLQRLFIHCDVLDEVTTRLSAAVAGLGVGDPSEESTVVGPLISPEATKRVHNWILEARAAGARIIVGGDLRDGVLEPTLITDVTIDSPLVCEEVFGPVLTLIPYDDLRDALEQLSNSRFGLNASLYTGSLSSAMAHVRRTEAGSILVNVPPSFRSDHMPYGGVKDSGQGREGVRYAIRAMSAERLVVFA